MAAPNLLRPTLVTGKMARLALTTSAQTFINNPATSGKLIRVIRIWFTNIDGAVPVDITLNSYSQDDIGGTAMALISTLSIPADAVVPWDGPYYLEEDQSLGALAAVNSDAVAHAAYEEVS